MPAAALTAGSSFSSAATKSKYFPSFYFPAFTTVSRYVLFISLLCSKNSRIRMGNALAQIFVAILDRRLLFAACWLSSNKSFVTFSSLYIRTDFFLETVRRNCWMFPDSAFLRQEWFSISMWVVRSHKNIIPKSAIDPKSVGKIPTLDALFYFPVVRMSQQLCKKTGFLLLKIAPIVLIGAREKSHTCFRGFPNLLRRVGDWWLSTEQFNVVFGVTMCR